MFPGPGSEIRMGSQPETGIRGQRCKKQPSEHRLRASRVASGVRGLGPS